MKWGRGEWTPTHRSEGAGKEEQEWKGQKR